MINKDGMLLNMTLTRLSAAKATKLDNPEMLYSIITFLMVISTEFIQNIKINLNFI